MGLQSIYDQLRSNGLSETGAIGLMGNWACESGCESCRLQGDFTPDRSISKNYAKNTNNFIYDAKGWGLAQWTYWSRKKALLDYCNSLSVSIADEKAQVDFALKELKEGYKGLFSFLCKASKSQLHTVVERVCKEYERPAVNNVEERFAAANRIAASLNSSTTPTPTPENPQSNFKLPELKRGSKGKSVKALQGILVANGQSVGFAGYDGDFGYQTESAVKNFQARNGIVATGIVDEETWKCLLGL